MNAPREKHVFYLVPVSIGPMLRGLATPVNDLSCGALVDDNVYTIALTAIRAAAADQAMARAGVIDQAAE